MIRKPPLAALVAASLDPAFSATPFQAGQTGERWRGGTDLGQLSWPLGPAEVIWCASTYELRATHPLLTRLDDQDDVPNPCVDFVLKFDTRGVLTRMNLEVNSLSQTFEILRMDHEARISESLIGQTARDVCLLLPGLIKSLLERTSA